MRGRPRIAALAAVIAIAIVMAVVLSQGGPSDSGSRTAAGLPTPPSADRAPARSRHPRASEPVAGETAADAVLPTDSGSNAAAPSKHPSTSKRSKSKVYTQSYTGANAPTKDAAINNADVLKNGIALPPIEAPGEVRAIVESGNQIARTPYLWGGGHGKWLDKGYDCSGSISYALASAGLLNSPLDSGRLMGWGKPGKGKWITIYANSGHVFMVVAGVRFDTSGTRVSGSRWQASMRPVGGFEARHPVGL